MYNKGFGDRVFGNFGPQQHEKLLCDMRISCIIRGSGIVFFGNFGPQQHEKLLCDYYQLVKSLSPSEREESSKQL